MVLVNLDQTFCLLKKIGPRFGRKEFRKIWLHSINELTDYQLQIDAWMNRSNDNPHWSYIEFMCCYFDEVLAEESYESYIVRGWISSTEHDVIKNWHDALEQYESPLKNDCDHQAILSDPNWNALVAEGEKAKVRLKMLLTATEQALLRKISYVNTR